MVSQQSRRGSVLGVLSVVWIVVTSGGVFFNSDPVVRYALVFDVLLVLAQLKSVGKVLLSRYANQCALIILMVVCVTLSVLANSDYASLLTYARLVVILTLAFGTSLLMENEAIAETFVKVVVILAGISLILFYSEIVDNSAGLFPVIEFHDYRYVNAFFYLFFESIERRNLSIFIEPGLYQIYLNIALFALLYSKKSFRHKYVAVASLLGALYSTNSTTGFILGLVIIGGQAFSSGQRRKNVISLAAKIVVVFAIVGVVLASEFFSTNIEAKFHSDKQQSFVTRQNSTIIDLLIIAENPLTGGGVGAYQSSLDTYDSSGLSIDAATNTFSQLGAIVGLPFVLLIIWRVAVYVSRLKVNFVGKWIFFAVYIVSFSTEPFVLYPLFYLPVFMSFRSWQSHPKANLRFSTLRHDLVGGQPMPTGEQMQASWRSAQ